MGSTHSTVEVDKIIYGKIQDFYLQKDFFDMIIVCGDINISAHRLVLCCFSEYFCRRFRENQTHFDKLDLSKFEVDPSILPLIIEFMYKNSITLDSKNIEKILRASVFLKIPLLVDVCNDFIVKNMNCDNSLSWYQISRELKLTVINDHSSKHIYDNFMEISKKREMMLLSEKDLKDLLFISNLKTNLEELAFKVMADWINHDKPNRKHLVIELILMVRYQHLSAKFISENMDIFGCVESYKIFSKWLAWHLSPKNRSDDQHKLAFIELPHFNEVEIKIYQPNCWVKAKKLDNCSDVDIISSAVMDNKLIIVDKDYVRLLDLYTFKWSILKQLTYTDDFHPLCAWKGELFFISKDLHGKILFQSYDFSTLEMKTLEQPEFCLWHPGSHGFAMYKGSVYALNTLIKHLQIYDTMLQKWTLKKIPLSLSSCKDFAAVGEFLYAFVSKKIHRYDVEKDCWAELFTMPQNVGECMKTAIVNDKIYIISMVRFKDCAVHVYDPTTNSLASLEKPTNSFNKNNLLCPLPSMLF